MTVKRKGYSSKSNTCRCKKVLLANRQIVLQEFEGNCSLTKQNKAQLNEVRVKDRIMRPYNRDRLLTETQPAKWKRKRIIVDLEVL